MIGKILALSEEGGLISGEDSKRYQFLAEEYKENRIPKKGILVDFEISEDGFAIEIYTVEEELPEEIEEPEIKKITGKILFISEEHGLIRGEDGKRYRFDFEEYKEEETIPRKGQVVDFKINENGYAVEIYDENANKYNDEDDDESYIDSILENEDDKKNIFKESWDIYLNTILRNYSNFDGVASRREYWLFTAVSGVIYLFLSLISFSIYGILGAIYSLIVLLPGIAIGVRRLHDIKKSGWMSLIVLIPIVGIIIMLVWFVLPSRKKNNPYLEGYKKSKKKLKKALKN